MASRKGSFAQLTAAEREKKWSSFSENRYSDDFASFAPILRGPEDAGRSIQRVIDLNLSTEPDSEVDTLVGLMLDKICCC